MMIPPAPPNNENARCVFCDSARNRGDDLCSITLRHGRAPASVNRVLQYLTATPYRPWRTHTSDRPSQFTADRNRRADFNFINPRTRKRPREHSRPTSSRYDSVWSSETELTPRGSLLPTGGVTRWSSFSPRRITVEKFRYNIRVYEPCPAFAANRFVINRSVHKNQACRIRIISETLSAYDLVSSGGGGCCGGGGGSSGRGGGGVWINVCLNETGLRWGYTTI